VGERTYLGNTSALWTESSLTLKTFAAFFAAFFCASMLSAQTENWDATTALREAMQADMRGRKEASLVQFERALQLYLAKADRIGEAHARFGLGVHAFTAGRNDEAQKFIEDSLRLFVAEKNALGEAKALSGLGDLSRHLGLSDAARLRYKNALRIYVDEKNRAGEANVMLRLGELERMSGRNDEARQLYVESKRLYGIVRDRIGEANVLAGLGELERKLGRHEDARRDYLEAREIFKQTQTPLGEANVLNGLAELERTVGRYDAALGYFRESRRLYQTLQDRQGEANVLLGLGDLARASEKPEVARRYIEDALVLYKGVESRLGEANSLLILGKLDSGNGNDVQARSNFEQSRRLFKAENDPLGEGNALFYLGELEQFLGSGADGRTRFRDAAILYGLAGLPEKKSEADARALEMTKTVEPQPIPWWRAWESWALFCAAVLSILGLLRFYGWRTRSKEIDTSGNPSQQPDIGRRWLFNRCEASTTTVVFVHGIWSNPAGFRFSETASWPQVLYEDARAGQPNIYLGQYYTATDSGFFDIPAASEELRVQLNSDSADGKEAPLRSERIIFIVHSTGGLVARDLLTRHPDLFKGKKVGLVLVASPSRGSAWANRLNMLIDVANNKMAGQLQKGNEWTDDLDKRFADFVHKDDTQRGFSIKGVDLFENRFVAGNFWLFRWLIPTRTVVVSERDSSSYFGAGKMVPGTDHFSIAKPSGVDHPSHQYLMEWWQRTGW
jgi:tetratricopeptide (TPR) repeat protein